MNWEHVTDAELAAVDGGALPLLWGAFAVGAAAGALVGIYAGERGSITDAVRAQMERTGHGM
jgi:lactobin A/cerein 7B family class IIb bacteriocin